MEGIPLEKQINPIESKSFHCDSPISVILLHHNVITNPSPNPSFTRISFQQTPQPKVYGLEISQL